ncbi:MAG TPA: hypothetical protein VIL33_03505, partial [Rhodothermia bacterium]
MSDVGDACSRRLPPVVLMVGDFNEEQAFSSEPGHAWSVIVTEVRSVCRHSEILDEVARAADGSQDTQSLVQVMLKHHPEAGGCVEPFPVKVEIVNYLGAGDQRDALRRRLHGLLRTFNVVGIIACGTAGAVAATLEALEPLDVPVVVTLSSATHGKARQLAPLQLMPNNALQARTILATCDVILSQPETSREIHVLAAPRGDPYVDSMVRELEALASHGGYDFKLTRVAEADPANLGRDPNRDAQLLICVGYEDVVTKAMTIAHRFRSIILSDGCSPFTTVGPAVFRSRPSAAPAQYAVDAWSAFREVYREYRALGGQLHPPIRLIQTIV